MAIPSDFDAKKVSDVANDLFRLYSLTPLEGLAALSIALVAVARQQPTLTLEHVQGAIAAQWKRVDDRGGLL